MRLLCRRAATGVRGTEGWLDENAPRSTGRNPGCSSGEQHATGSPVATLFLRRSSGGLNQRARSSAEGEVFKKPGFCEFCASKAATLKRAESSASIFHLAGMHLHGLRKIRNRVLQENTQNQQLIVTIVQLCNCNSCLARGTATQEFPWRISMKSLPTDKLQSAEA